MNKLFSKKIPITDKAHKNTYFIGCENCGAKCCSSATVFATLFDLERVSKYFPVFFKIQDNTISLILFFQYGRFEKQKCAYLNNEVCGIYEERPYACRVYPFSFDYKENKALLDVDCPHIIESGKDGMKLIEDGMPNKSILRDFVGAQMTEGSKENLEQTSDFVMFCNQNGLLSPFLEVYPTFSDFQTNISDKLYVLHPQRTAVVRMKYKERFNNEAFVKAIQFIIASMQNLYKLQKA